METERLILREYTYEDFDALYEIMSDSETMQHYPNPFDEEHIRKWIEWNLKNYKRYGFGLWAVVLKETGRFIGDCGITMQNTGYDCLYSYMKYTNTGSCSVAVKNGMKKIKEYPDAKNEILCVYAVTRDEWETLKYIESVF